MIRCRRRIDALPEVEEHGRRVPLDEEARRRPRRVRRGRAAAEHGETRSRPSGSRVIGRIVRAPGEPTPRRRRRRRRRCRRADRDAALGWRAHDRQPPRSLESLVGDPVLRRSRSEALGRVAAGMRARRFRRGEVIFHLGDPGDALFIIVSGRGQDLAPVRDRRRGDPRDAPAAATSSASWPCSTARRGRRRRPRSSRPRPSSCRATGSAS